MADTSQPTLGLSPAPLKPTSSDERLQQVSLLTQLMRRPELGAASGLVLNRETVSGFALICLRPPFSSSIQCGSRPHHNRSSLFSPVWGCLGSPNAVVLVLR